MEQFKGFPTRMQFTPIPNIFFSTLLPQISDTAELKTVLHILGMLYRKRGYPQYVSFSELAANKSLISSLRKIESSTEPVLHNALEMATRRGVFLHLALDRDGVTEDAYFLNTDTSRRAIAKIQNGELKIPGLKAKETTFAETEEQPDIFTVYEQNIGVLTPIIAEELRDAERVYPESWIRDAIREAVAHNKRSWRYVTAILERWASEGKDNGTDRRHPKKTDPDKYIKGKYGHMVRR